MPTPFILRLLALSLGLAAPAIAGSFIDWNPSGDVAPDAAWRLPSRPVAPDGPRMTVKDGHFSLAGRRFRAWGVNLSFNANLPAPEDAAMVADRLAAAGVNAVRMHHMDSAKYPRGLWHRDGGFRLDPEGLARLDRFIAELARSGIRVNLNLHVGAKYSAMLDSVPESPTHYDKCCLQFVPQLQQAWRDYARMLLGHRNPQRGGLRYAEDPAIAWVEISNENSFWFGGDLDRIRNAPESGFYRTMLDRQYTAWLLARHTDAAGLRKAWNVKSKSLSGERIALWGEPETPERADDRLRFLAATEKKFFDMAREFIRREMRCKALVVGTQGYGPMGLYAQAGMDFTDTHAYWQHPHFPHHPWDPSDWTIGRLAMAEHPKKATFLNLAAQRVPGRPFTVSEYSHPAPNDFQVECVPMIAAVAAVEDWDGVWFYSYEHNNNRWNRPFMGNFFDLRANPAKWAFMPAGAALFREAGIAPSKNSFLSSLTPPAPKTAWRNPAAAMEKYQFDRSGRGMSADDLTGLIYRNHNASGDSPGRAGFMVESLGAGVMIGHGADFAEQTDGMLKIEAPEFCAVALASMDGKSPNETRRLLLTACGRAENRNMKFNKDRTSVGRHWGKTPVRAEAATGSLKLPPGNWRAWALKPDGIKGAEIKLGREDGRSMLPMSPKHGTLCYLLERG
jgi:hypothetical protein